MKKNENSTEQEVKEERSKYVEPLDKKQMNKLLACGEDDGYEDNYNSEEDPIPVVIFDSELQYIRELRAVDIVFLVDATASMRVVMKGVKRFMRKLVWDALKCLTQYFVDEVDMLMVGLVIYRDHSEQQVSQVVLDLTSDFGAFRDSVKRIWAKGGGDGPEAVLDGLNDVLTNISWRNNSFKFIYHVLDAPPHGKIFSNLDDSYSNGCPCRLNYQDLLIDLRSIGIEYNIVKLSNDLDNMIELFSQVCKIDVMFPEIKVDHSKKASQYD